MALAPEREAVKRNRYAPEVEASQRASLKRHRRLALALLLFMAAVFVAAQLVPEPGFWVRLVRAGAEAAMVGALADWFAVTALFRHPFGIPIPHTAIVPRNKNRIGDSLGGFVARNFLEPHLVAQKLRSLDTAGLLSRWLASRSNADAVAERLVSALAVFIDSIEDVEVREFLGRALEKKIEAVELAPVLGRVLELLTESGQHHELFVRALGVARAAVARQQNFIYEKVEERTAWWVPRTVDRRIAEAIIHGVHQLLADLADQEHPARQEFERSLRQWIANLQTSSAHQEQVEAIKTQLLYSPAVQAYVRNVWSDVRHLLLRDIGRPDSQLRGALRAGLQALASALHKDASMRGRLNRRLEKMVLGVVVPWRAEIGNFISEVVRSWDAQTMSERIELAVGRDLQFIRINGTLVGALVGCVLFLISSFAFPH